MAVSLIESRNFLNLVGNKDYFSSQGDLIALAEALYAASSEQVRGAGRASLEAGRAKLAQLIKLHDVAIRLNALTPLRDGKSFVLGPDLTTSQALKTDIESLGLSLSTSQNYYIQSTTTDKAGKPLSSNAKQVASQVEMTAAEAGKLVSGPDAQGVESRSTTDKDGNVTTYTLYKQERVLTASKDDVATLLQTIATGEETLHKEFTDEMMRVQAFVGQLGELQPAYADTRSAKARKDETRLVETRQSDLIERAHHAHRDKVREQRDIGPLGPPESQSALPATAAGPQAPTKETST